MAKKGRPKKAGERYPSGDLKPTTEPIAPALLARIRTDGVALGLDPRLGCEVGRLLLTSQLTTAQASVAFRIGEVYGRFERLKGKTRSVGSPSYQSGSRGEAGLAEENMTPVELGRLKQSILGAEAEFMRLQDEIPGGRARAAVEQLCVEDRAVNPMLYPGIRELLEHLGRRVFRMSSSRKGTGPVSARSSPKTSAPAAPKPNIDRIYWIEVVRRLRPDLSDADLSRAYETQQALKARGTFRAKRDADRRRETILVVRAPQQRRRAIIR